MLPAASEGHALEAVGPVGDGRGVQGEEIAVEARHRGPTTVWFSDPPVRAKWTVATPPASAAVASRSVVPLKVVLP